MTSPQHRRMVTSPVATTQMRFVSNTAALQQRVRIQTSLTNFQQKPVTSSPLNSPPSQQLQQLQLQKQLQQAALLQQQSLDQNQSESNVVHSRAAQLLQQRNLIRQQLGPQQQQQQQPQQTLIHQQQISMQQQKQLSQQHMAQLQARLQQHQQNNPPASPMPPKSPMVNQQIMSPHSMPPSPMQIPPKSPMLSFSSNQPTPNSPIARSPVYHQGINQPPSPMTQNQYQRPNSPMPRSPMLNQNQSPHGIRRPPSASSSPAMPDRPTSVENPSTPRTPFTIEHLVQDHSSIQYGADILQYANDSNTFQQNTGSNRENMHTGGGNPSNPCNPIPIPPIFGKFGFFKLGLRGGAPMWNYGRGAKRIPTPPGNTHAPDDKSLSTDIKVKKESHINKVSILRRKNPGHQSTMVSIVSTDYNELDDSSSTPPVTPPPSTSASKLFHKSIHKKHNEHELKDPNIMVLHSPSDKPLEIMDYDDDTNTVLSAEVSLSSAAQQNDAEDIVEIESLSQPDIAENFSSPLEPDQIPDEYLLFPGNMVVDMTTTTHFSDKEEEQEEEYSGENMHIVIRSPTTSDDEFIMQGKTKKYNAINNSGQTVNDTPESPDQQEIVLQPSPDVPVDDLSNYDGSDILMIDSNTKSPEDSISTKEDFEELIDEGSRKENLRKCDITTKHINEFHKYSNVFNYAQNIQQKQQQSPHVSARSVSSKSAQSISLITSPIGPTLPNKNNADKLIITQNTKLINTGHQTSKLTGIILTHNSAVRGNVLNVPKIVNTVSPSITIVSGSTSQIASILPSKFTVPVISASAVRHLSNVKVLDKASSSLSLSTHDSSLPKKIFEDDSVSPDSSNFEDDKSKDSSDEKSKIDSTPEEEMKSQPFLKSSSEKSLPMDEPQSPKQLGRKIEHLQVSNLSQKSQIPSPIISKSSPVIIHNTPELKMTAQVIQETSGHMQITATTENVNNYDSIDDTKSVVISIPSPTPSQEQMLDNIALQALENRRREFDSFDDVLDMIENITAEPPAILEENVTVKNPGIKREHSKNVQIPKNMMPFNEPPPPTSDKTESINISTNTKPSDIPQLSPLSQPTDLTADMANASQQLRTLLSSLQTSSTSSGTNVESVVKNLAIKGSSSTSPSTKQPIVASRIIQQTNKSPIVTNSNTVIVPNLKQKVPASSGVKTPRSSPIRIQQINTSPSTPALNLLTCRSATGGIHVFSDHSNTVIPTSVNQQPTSVITTASTSILQKTIVGSISTPTDARKPSLTLTAMLQNQPSATMTTQSTADTITAASLLGTPISLSKTGFTTALIQAQPNATITPITTNTISPTSVPSSTVITSPSFKVTSVPNLLHTQLTKVVRTKSTEEPNEMKTVEVKVEKVDALDDTKFSSLNSVKQDNSICKFSNISSLFSGKTDDSQNVLLKKLLQNTACASTQSPPPNTNLSTPTTVSTSVVSGIPSTDNTVKIAPTPTLSSFLPTPVIKTETQAVTQSYQKTTVPRMPIRETSFVSNPVISTQTCVNVPTSTQQHLHIDVKKCGPPTRTPSRDELLSPPTPRSSCSQESSLQTPPLVIKKEIISSSQQLQPIPVLVPVQDVKKELIDESSQHSEISDHSRSDIPIKEEETTDTVIERVLDKEELKKQKRRMYQQKRRQIQIQNKEQAGQPKKRPRKNSKIEEDYDTYIDGVLVQLRQLPPMNVCEPKLNRNFGVVPLYGTGDMYKFGTKGYSSQSGDLIGIFGNAHFPGYTDFYNSEPFGDIVPLEEKPLASTQRGFYDQEFPLIKYDIDEEKKLDLFCREDTPDSIVSSSSPECFEEKSQYKLLGLRVINEDDEEDISETQLHISEGRLSPVVQVIKPIPIRLKPTGGIFFKDAMDVSLSCFKPSPIF